MDNSMPTSIARKTVVLLILAVLGIGAVGMAGFWHPMAPNMAMTALLPRITLFSVVVGGAVDGINPCAFTVLLLFITALLTTLKGGTETNVATIRAKMVGMGSIYIGAVFLTYLAIGVGLLKAASIFTRAHIPARIGAVVAVLIGLWMIKDYFLPDWGWKLRAPVYLGVLSLLALQSTAFIGYAYLLLYNIVFILPLVAILILAAARPTLSRLAHWNLHHKEWVRLILGAGVVVMGLVILVTV
jgi:cytochrome c-type biogenesis protein